MALILVDAGRTALTNILHEQSLILAIGAGDPAWDALWGGGSPPDATSGVSALTDLIGVVKPLSKQFVTPDSEGEISISDGVDVQKYTASVDPTRFLFVRWRLDFGDAPTATIRELAVYFNTTFDAGIPSGQSYVEDTGANITDIGDIFGAERMPPISRTDTQQDFGRLIAI